MALNILLKRSSTANKRPVAASMAYGELNLNYDAATGGVYYKDSNNDIVKIGPAQVSATAPNASPAGSAGNSAGEFWYDTVNSELKVWTGSAWVSTSGGGGSVVGVTGTAPVQVDNTDPANPVISVDAGTTSAAGVLQLEDSTSSTSTTTAATPNAVKSAYDLANGALPKTGGEMSGFISFPSPGQGVVFFDNSNITLISDAVDIESSNYAASSTAVKTAYDLANAALPKAGGTATGSITFSSAPGPVIGVVFSDASSVDAINDSFVLTSSTTAASSTAVKGVYDIATAALPLAGGTMSGDIAFNATQNFPVSGIQDATLADKGVVQVGSNINVAAGVISVADGTTSAKGVVQLYNGTDSTSTTLALTAAQGKVLQDEIDALSVNSNLTLAGTFNATTGLVDGVTTAGTAAGFVVGNAVPAAAAGNSGFFVIVDVQGNSGPAGTGPYHIGDWFLSDGTAWTFLNVGYQATAATTSVEGLVYLATDAEVQAGTDTSNKAINPASLQSKVSDSTSTTNSYSIASSTAVKSAYDLANAALPLSGGTMTGPFTTSASGVIFFNGSDITAISDSTSTTSSSVAASSTAVKSAYDLALAAVPKSVATAKGDILVGTASGVVGVRSVGTDGQLLTVDSNTASGLAYTSTIDGGTF
jgi:hypothetical protein